MFHLCWSKLKKIVVMLPVLKNLQALKALILERMGKSEEALSLCLEATELLHKNVTLLMDDLTLSTLQIVFQRLGRCKFGINCYFNIYSYYLFISNLFLSVDSGFSDKLV